MFAPPMGGKEIGASSGGGTESRDRITSRFRGQRAEQQEPSMKHLWLILGVLLALGATAPQGKKKRKFPSGVNDTYLPGGFSVLRSHGDPEAAIFNPMEVFALPTLESGKSLETGLNVRSKREFLNPRRGRKRTRPACRGCYSWLSIVAPPGEETHNGTSVAPPGRETRNGTSSESFSGSEERSSEGD